MKLLVLLLSVAGAVVLYPHSFRTSTWTIVAADPSSGDVGISGASCVPLTFADALGALVPGKGVAATQALWDLDNRNKVYALLREGRSADQIIQAVADRSVDNAVDDRQYGVVTLSGGTPKVAAFTGKGTMAWAGSEQDAGRAVSVQGNILAGPAVVADALKAFKTDDRRGANTLPDRLMRALEAGSAGGDVRCNNSRVKQTAATAFILVARGGDAPYTAVDIGMTDQGTAKAPWLAISVKAPQFGPNPIVELRKKYDEWKAGKK